MVADKQGLILFRGSWHLFIICLFRWDLVYLKLVSNSLFGLVQGWPRTSRIVTTHHWAGLHSARNKTTGFLHSGQLISNCSGLLYLSCWKYLSTLQEINELTCHGTSVWRVPGKKKTIIWSYNNNWVWIFDHVSRYALPMDSLALRGTKKGTSSLQIEHIT